MVYRPLDLYESDSSLCDINHQKDYTAWTSYDKNNFLLLFIHIKTKHFFMEIIIYTFKQSVAKIFDGTTVFVSCKT